MKTAKRYLILLLAAVTLMIAGEAHADLKIDITRGNAQPLPVAIVDFQGKERGDGQIGVNITKVIEGNLKRSGLFTPIDRGAFIQEPSSIEFQPRFADWRVINAQALIFGTANLQEDGKLRVEFRLWDVFAEQQLAGLAYTTEPDNWRRIAHIISDAIYERLTGEKGYFDSRIVYVAENGRADRRTKRLAIMDQDGANHRFMTDGNTMILTPRFSPSTQKIAYMAYYSGRPRVYMLDIDTGQEEVVGDFPGMTFAPRFSPDGNTILMSLAIDGNSDLYSMNLKSRTVRRLTDHSSIDTSPCSSPDGKHLVFTSDRGGSPQLYTMRMDGSGVQRITFGEGKYTTPVWSPRGDLIAFTRQYKGLFYIGVIKPDGSGERLLTESYLDEGPTWSPNGRVLSFYRQEPTTSRGETKSRLYTIDLTGYNLQEIQTPQEASDPAWSPVLQ